ncbi:uncharacterized protein PAC_19638 [Phialocephala subalpina]|uniref:R3H-associated N-terminal domain-containing protein n=1 Tax=Phialocephala subalpina TaxID=576137 RepID=A0A1L7XXK0_9HELO|nr:uncharacterized protein PAC_19638 [Phialocephala subalpina]
MAIYSSVPPPSQQPPPSSSSAPGIDIESWTVSALQSLSVSPSARGTGVTLSIPLDDGEKKEKTHTVYKKKELVRRDSMKRREALLKGKEGSRRRQRWENDQFLHVPNAQPPLPSDWAPHPTHRVHNVPYYLAPLWDAGVRHRAEEIASAKRLDTLQRKGFSPTDQGKGRVPQDLRQKLKKSKGAKTLLQDLELEVRKFVKEHTIREQKLLNKHNEVESDVDSEDEEIVFIGRDAHGNGITMSDEVKDVMEEQLEREKKIYESLEGTPEGGFARWLVHCVAGYYGLSCRSVTVGVRRESWVGVRGIGGEVVGGEGLPRPLWGLV